MLFMKEIASWISGNSFLSFIRHHTAKTQMKTIHVFILLAMLFGSTISQGSPKCNLHRSVVSNSYLGWPAELSCERVKMAYIRFLAINRRYGQADNTTCYIINVEKNETLWSTDVDMTNYYSDGKLSYLTHDVETESPVHYQVIMKGESACFYENITLAITQTEEKCTQNEKRFQDFPRRPHMLSELICKDDLISSEGSYNYTVEWYRNCSELITSTSRSYLMKDDSLIIPSADFNLSGIYSCAFSYKGQRRFIRHFTFCVKPRTVISEPGITCPTEVATYEGRDVKINCMVNDGPSPKTSRFGTSITWKRVRGNVTSQCRSAGGSANAGFEGKANCFMNISDAEAHNEKCYLYEPTIDQKSSRNKIHRLTLALNDIQSEDFGTYHVTYKSFGGKATATVNISKKSEKFGTYAYVLIGLAGLIFICFTTILLILILRKLRRGKI